MFALPVILIFTTLLITIQIPIICTLYYSQNYMLKMLSIKLSINMESHPLRVRGLKQRAIHSQCQDGGVASFTGAWIETLSNLIYYDWCCVASFTGAWIETSLIRQPANLSLSHPLRVRGLKLFPLGMPSLISEVASFTGAWIETYSDCPIS